jgi:hypothetical protein
VRSYFIAIFRVADSAAGSLQLQLGFIGVRFAVSVLQRRPPMRSVQYLRLIKESGLRKG